MFITGTKQGIRTESDMNLHDYDKVVINSSAGKDSQTMLAQVVDLAKRTDYPLSRLIVAHADLGRMEWEGTKQLAQTQAEHYGLRFEVFARPQGDILTHVEQRGMWPSSTNRYCTSDHKRGQIQKLFTQLSRENPGKTIRILNCMGFRAEESPARAKRQAFEPNTRGTIRTRVIDTWLPIHTWTEQQVWWNILASGVPHHYAYDLGMPRLSCIFCIFAPAAALILAGKHNRALLDEYAAIEASTGHLFREKTSIASIKEAVESNQETGAMTGAWNM